MLDAESSNLAMSEGAATGKVSSMRVNWQLKTVWPVAMVLLAGMLLFLLATLSFRDPDRHRVLAIAGAGAVAICGVVIVVLASRIQRPMVEPISLRKLCGEQRRNRRSWAKFQPHGRAVA